MAEGQTTYRARFDVSDLIAASDAAAQSARAYGTAIARAGRATSAAAAQFEEARRPLSSLAIVLGSVARSALELAPAAVAAKTATQGLARNLTAIGQASQSATPGLAAKTRAIKSLAPLLPALGRGAHDAGGGMREVGAASSSATPMLGALRSGVAAAKVAVVALGVAAAAAALKILELGQAGSQIQQTATAYAAMGNTAADLERLKAAVDGAVPEALLMKMSNQARLTGLNAESLEKLATVAKGASVALGRDFADSFERLVLGVTKQERELLDELGIKLRSMDVVYREFAARAGISVKSLTDEQKMAAFAAEVLKGSTLQLATAAAMGTSEFDKGAATFQDFKDRLSVLAAETLQSSGTLRMLGEALAELQGWVDANREAIGEAISSGFAALVEVGKAVFAVLSPLLPALPALASGFGTLAQGVASAMQVIGPFVTVLAQAGAAAVGTVGAVLDAAAAIVTFGATSNDTGSKVAQTALAISRGEKTAAFSVKEHAKEMANLASKQREAVAAAEAQSRAQREAADAADKAREAQAALAKTMTEIGLLKKPDISLDVGNLEQAQSVMSAVKEATSGPDGAHELIARLKTAGGTAADVASRLLKIEEAVAAATQQREAALRAETDATIAQLRQQYAAYETGEMRLELEAKITQAYADQREKLVAITSEATAAGQAIEEAFDRVVNERKEGRRGGGKRIDWDKEAFMLLASEREKAVREVDDKFDKVIDHFGKKNAELANALGGEKVIQIHKIEYADFLKSHEEGRVMLLDKFDKQRLEIEQQFNQTIANVRDFDARLAAELEKAQSEAYKSVDAAQLQEQIIDPLTALASPVVSAFDTMSQAVDHFYYKLDEGEEISKAWAQAQQQAAQAVSNSFGGAIASMIEGNAGFRQAMLGAVGDTVEQAATAYIQYAIAESTLLSGNPFAAIPLFIAAKAAGAALRKLGQSSGKKRGTDAERGGATGGGGTGGTVSLGRAARDLTPRGDLAAPQVINNYYQGFVAPDEVAISAQRAADRGSSLSGGRGGKIA